jgi:hypothetical protein
LDLSDSSSIFNRFTKILCYHQSFYLDPKDGNKVSIVAEASSANIVISNEDDSSVGDFTKDSKVSSIS